MGNPRSPYPNSVHTEVSPVDRLAAVQDRLAGWIGDLTALHDLTERLARAGSLEDTLHETLRAGADLVGARRGLIALEPADGLGPERTIGLGLGQSDLGQIETIPYSAHSAVCLDRYERRDRADPSGPHGPHDSDDRAEPTDPANPTNPDDQANPDDRNAPYDRLLDELPGAEPPEDRQPGNGRTEIAHPNIAEEDGLDPRHREVAARLGYAASYAVPLTTVEERRYGAAFWLYDEPAEPTERQRHLLGLYLHCATEHIARQLTLTRAQSAVATVQEELLPSRLPRVPGVRLAVRHRTGPRGGGDWYDVLPLPEGALGLSVGGVTGTGPSAIAAMGRLRASLRAYAVMEGEDPVAVLSDLELLMRITEPARSATALFGYAEPAERKIVVAGAGHCPPLIIGPHRCNFAETTLSAPLGMLACWEAPSVELCLEPGETLLLYSDGLLRRTGDSVDRAYTRLQTAALSATPAMRDDPDALVDHVLHTVLPNGRADADSEEDVVLLAARF